MSHKEDFRMTKCKELKVSKEVCYISFGKGRCNSSNDEFITIRGEQMILDLDSKGYVIGIDLMSDDKPCQNIHGDKK